MYEQDYVMRMIHQMIRMLIKLLFHIDPDQEDMENTINQETKETYKRMKEQIDSGKIKEAQEQLQKSLRSEQKEDLKLVLLFYSYLNQKDTSFLEECGITRKEIAEGLKQAAAFYGCESLAEVMMDLESDE